VALLLRKFHCSPDDLTITKRTGTSNRIEIQFRTFNHLSRPDSFAKLFETLCLCLAQGNEYLGQIWDRNLIPLMRYWVILNQKWISILKLVPCLSRVPRSPGYWAKLPSITSRVFKCRRFIQDVKVCIVSRCKQIVVSNSRGILIIHFFLNIMNLIVWTAVVVQHRKVSIDKVATTRTRRQLTLLHQMIFHWWQVAQVPRSLVEELHLLDAYVVELVVLLCNYDPCYHLQNKIIHH
jgi:hypothetical protein